MALTESALGMHEDVSQETHSHLSDKLVEPATREFGIYEHIARNPAAAQFSGFTFPEYERAVADPRTQNSVLFVGNTVVDIPHLVPLDNFDWLNMEHYAELFPEDVAHDTIRHYTDYGDDLPPGAEVSSAIKYLAEANGLLAFDYSETDKDYETRIKTMLAENGIDIEEEQEIGKQTYYAGKVTLKKGYDPAKPIVDMNDAFTEMKNQGLIPADAVKNGASYQDTIDEKEADHMYEIYIKAFEDTNKDPCRQGLTPEEFKADMQNPKIAKLVYAVNGEVSTMCILGNDLGEYEWLNPEKLKVAYPEEHKKEQILYFPALATDRERQGDGNTVHIVNLIAQMVEFGNNEIVVAFDSCKNNDFLATFLAAMINETPQANIEFQTLDTQTYKTYRLKPAESTV